MEQNGNKTKVILVSYVKVASVEPTKTQMMWFGSRQQIAKMNILEVPVSLSPVNVLETVRGLCVIIDSQLSLSA